MAEKKKVKVKLVILSQLKQVGYTHTHLIILHPGSFNVYKMVIFYFYKKKKNTKQINRANAQTIM